MTKANYWSKQTMPPFEKKAIDALDLMGSDPETAERILDALILEYPDEICVMRCYGRAKLVLRKYEEAEIVLSRLVHMRPEHEWDSISLFVSHYRQGNIDSAFEELDRFFNLTGTYTDDYDLALSDMRGEIDGDEFDHRSAEIERKKTQSRSNRDERYGSSSS